MPPHHSISSTIAKPKPKPQPQQRRAPLPLPQTRAPLPLPLPPTPPPQRAFQAVPLELRLQDLGDNDRAQLRADAAALAETERRIALLHAPGRVDRLFPTRGGGTPGADADRAFFHNNNLPNASRERRRELIGLTMLAALPFLAKVAGLARATKTYHDEALPSDILACRDRLYALGLCTTRAFAYMEELVECQTICDAVLRAGGTPLRPL